MIINDTHSLIQGSGDVFGIEVISTINDLISHNKDIIIIFN